MARIKKEDVTLLIILAILAVLNCAWVPGAISSILSMLNGPSGETP